VYRTRVRLRAGFASLVAGSLLLPAAQLPPYLVLPLACLLAVAISWWLLPGERLRPGAGAASTAAHGGR
jgi:hypothetical protein